MKYIKAFKMFESSPVSVVNFIIKNETTPEEFKKEIQDCLDERDYGSGQTFEDVVEDIVKDSIDAAGKSDQKSKMVSQLWDCLDHDGSTNSYNGEVVCEYEITGPDGSGYVAKVGDVTTLLSDLKKLIETGSF